MGDATSEVYARFYDYEGTLPAMDSFKRYIKQYGIPQSVYLDRHSTYKATVQYQTIEDQLEDRQLMSQFERSLQELGVTVIHAHSPQAKGRVERLFGTFQDRVIKEIRLAGIRNKDEGNAFLDTYLPGYNRRYRVSLAKDANLHRLFKNHRELDRILSIRRSRALRNDFTIAHNKRLYQIKDNIRAKKVTVEERTDGSMRILHNGQCLKYQEITVRPEKECKELLKLHKTWDRGKPSGTHPWRAPLDPKQREKPMASVVNNFVSGLILVVERPVGVGDLIEIGTLSGTVKRIGIRSSTVRTGQGAEVIVPNADLV